MIELNKKTQQDFLNRRWVQRLLNAGVNMSDAKYCIVYNDEGNDAVELISVAESEAWFYTPTYTVSELLYKLHEWIYPTIDGVKYSGGLCLWKDAPFYPAQYKLKDKDDNFNEGIFFCPCEYPIESLASLLIKCHQNDIGIPKKDTGDISDK